MKSILTALFFLFPLSIFAQQKYYKMPNGKIIDSETYLKVKENLSKNGKLEEIIIAKTQRQDSIIITPKITVLTQKDIDGNYIDPYGEAKKLIGSRFPIERFKNEEGINYSKASFEGRPTLINFWFTSCVPCVAEIPLLNSMRTTATNRFNFIAITFENKKNVDAFLKNVDFQFTHLTDAKMQLDSLKIFALPTSVILDKNGVVVDVYGEISKSSKQVSDLLSQLL